MACMMLTSNPTTIAIQRSGAATKRIVFSASVPT
jgi:hypothetical protein